MQIKKITALFMMLAAVASTAFSQSVHGGTLPPLKPVEKTVYDTAYVKVYYEFSYRPDSLSKGRKEGQTILLVGDKAQSFVDYLTTGQILSTTRSPLPNAHRWKPSR